MGPSVFQFLWVWNDLLAALVGRRGEQWQVLTAGAFVAMAVPLFVCFSLQRYFVRGLTAGSVKG